MSGGNVIREPDLDRSTKAVVRAVVDEAKGASRPVAATPILIGELAQRVRSTLAGWGTENGAAENRQRMADELALVAYLTLAAQYPAGALSPSLLTSLNRRLVRTLEALPPGLLSGKELEP